MKRLFTYYIFCFCAIWLFLSSCEIRVKKDPSPTKGQQTMIDRKYGMFLHYGMNTYLNVEWSDGSTPAGTFNPPADIAQKASVWVSNAKKAGMRSIVLTTKHHDGFCLWNSQYTTYDIANDSVKHNVDIVKAVADACQKEGIAFAVYYSLWDRHEASYRSKNKHLYIDFMKNQLKELLTNYGPVCELWFDGGWDRKTEDWYLEEIYDFVKDLQPDCQISTNWTIGKRPIDMRYGDSIKYFPSDFRLWDPNLPRIDDPKIYTHKGKKYYLPYESTQTISVIGSWFNHPEDSTVREVEELEEIFFVATSNDNCLLLNIPPDKDGVQNPKAIAHVDSLARLLGMDNGKPFPKKLKTPSSLTSRATAISQNAFFKQDTLHYGAQNAVDSDVTTCWMSTDSIASILVNLNQKVEFNHVFMITGENSIRQFRLDILQDGQWTTVYQSDLLPLSNLNSFMGYGFIEFDLPEKAFCNQLCFNIQQSNGHPSIYSIRLK